MRNFIRNIKDFDLAIALVVIYIVGLVSVIYCLRTYDERFVEDYIEVYPSVEAYPLT